MDHREGLVSKAAMIAAAVDEGLGDTRTLARRFVDWQQLGLLGKAAKKAARQGGEGLWHPNQQVLFLDLLRCRDRGLRIPTLANVPVAWWRDSIQGIETEQAQRALEFWAGYLPGTRVNLRQPPGGRRPRGTGDPWGESRPKGERSLRRRAIELRVEWLSVPGASAQSKRELRQLLEVLNEGIDVSPDAFVHAVVPVFSPDGEATPQQRRAARLIHRGIALQHLAVDHLGQLCAPAAVPLWEWARRIDQSERPNYLRDQARLIADAEVGHLFRRPLVDDLVQQACSGLLVILGIGLACNLPNWRMQPESTAELPPSPTGEPACARRPR